MPLPFVHFTLSPGKFFPMAADDMHAALANVAVGKKTEIN